MCDSFRQRHLLLAEYIGNRLQHGLRWWDSSREVHFIEFALMTEQADDSDLKSEAA